MATHEPFDLGTYSEPQPFKYWCQKVLPLVYDDSLSYYELLAKVVDYINKLVSDDNTLIAQVNELQHWFDNLDVSEEINAKLDTMAENGELYALMEPYLDDLSEYIRTNAAQQQVYNENTRQILFEENARQIVYNRETRTMLQNMVGHPYTASTAEAMTDTSKVYVYTGTTTSSLTNGHWYFYDGTGWTDGGVYNSTALETDKTLLVDGAAADARYTGIRVNGITNPFTWTVDAEKYNLLTGASETIESPALHSYANTGKFSCTSFSGIAGFDRTYTDGCAMVLMWDDTTYIGVATRTAWFDTGNVSHTLATVPYFNTCLIQVYADVWETDYSDSYTNAIRRNSHETDAGLKTEGIAADAGAVGAEFTHVKQDISELDEYVKIIPQTANIYDADRNSVVSSDPQYTTGTVYLDGYVGDLVISSEGNTAAYFSDLHVYNANNVDMQVSYGETVSTSVGVARQGKIVTIPNGAYKMTFVYRTYHAATGTILNRKMMVTKGNTLTSGIYIPFEGKHYFSEIVGNDLLITPVYVSLSGNDDNDGLSPESAFATFAKAFSKSNVVYAQRGIYNQTVAITNRKGVKLFPYDNDETYAHSSPIRQKIVLSGGYEIPKTQLSNSGTVYSVAFNESNGYAFKLIFVDHTLQPIISGTQYRANVYVNYTANQHCKLKPVLTLAECQNETNTFFYDGTTLYCNISDASFTAITTVKDGLTRLRIENCDNVDISDVSCVYSYERSVYVNACTNVSFINCEASYSGIGSGFELNNADAEFDNCYTTNNGVDGFNYHGYGTTIMNDCCAEYNYDDGCSHHDGCIGEIHGGIYKSNNKGGISPAYGALVNIYNVIAENNAGFGIGYLSTNNGHRAMTGQMYSCVMVDNPYGLFVQELCTVTAVNCKYANNTTDKLSLGSLVEY